MSTDPANLSAYTKQSCHSDAERGGGIWYGHAASTVFTPSPPKRLMKADF
jgi:hypothetical protein